jgi:beta-phosphoglucomutase-like phosphatase (HAD superfamily)
MNTSALITLLITHGIVTFFMVNFFRKVLKAPKKPEPDSYSENDND